MLTNFNEYINEGIFGGKHDKIVGELIDMIKEEPDNLSVDLYAGAEKKINYLKEIEYFKGFINDLKIHIYSHKKDNVLYDQKIYELELDDNNVSCSQNKLRKLVKTIVKIINDNNNNNNNNNNDDIIKDIYNKKISKIGRTTRNYDL